jgi:hypothetical protein
MFTKLDAKFYGEIRKVKDDSIVPDDQYIVFLVKDDAFALTLPIYRSICAALGADQEQLDALDRMIGRVESWRIVYPDKCKIPDAKGEKLLDK